jgi:dimethylhistidine N-methyltransferase
MKYPAVEAYRFYNESLEVDDFYREVIAGFIKHPRSIPPKYFYDEEGSRLFESICEQPEYYLTRTEIMLLEKHADDIKTLAGSGCYLVEPGSGSCEKVRLLLETLRPTAYVPMDISCEHLKAAAAGIATDYPWLDVHAVCADITRELSLSFIPEQVTPVMFYPGSSIGNFDPDAAVEFLTCLARIAGPGGGLLIGVDLKKDPATLHQAYNDASGVTAAFNLNLLQRANRELDADFDMDAFEHHARYNSAAGRIEMHLTSTCKQTVNINGHSFDFNAGESIHTENSYKYTNNEFRSLAQRAGFTSCAVWTDSDSLFSLHFLRVGWNLPEYP